MNPTIVSAQVEQPLTMIADCHQTGFPTHIFRPVQNGNEGPFWGVNQSAQYDQFRWEYVRMEELHAYAEEKGVGGVKWRSFDFEPFSKKPHTWVIYDKSHPHWKRRHLNSSGRIMLCPFSDPCLYVPQGWAMIAKRLIEQSVYRLEIIAGLHYGRMVNGNLLDTLLFLEIVHQGRRVSHLAEPYNLVRN